MTFFALIFAWILLAIQSGTTIQPTHTTQDHGMQVTGGCQSYACRIGGPGQ